MRRRGIITFSVACLFVTGGHVRACHTEIHYTKAQIQAAEIKLYEHAVIKNVALGNEQTLQQLLAERSLHPRLFAAEHPELLKELKGDMLYHKKHPFSSPIVLTAPITPVTSSPSVPRVPPDIVPPGSPAGSPPGSEPPTSSGQLSGASVPEPSSGLLGLTGVVIGLLFAIRDRRLT
jgi:hypothetical protein